MRRETLCIVARGVPSVYAQRNVVQCGTRYNGRLCAEKRCAMWHEVERPFMRRETLCNVARGITSFYAQRNVVQCGTRYNVRLCAEKLCAIWHEV